MVCKEGGMPSKASAGRKLSAALGEERLAEDSSQNRQPHRPFPRADLGRLEGSHVDPGECEGSFPSRWVCGGQQRPPWGCIHSINRRAVGYGLPAVRLGTRTHSSRFSFSLTKLMKLHKLYRLDITTWFQDSRNSGNTYL